MQQHITQWLGFFQVLLLTKFRQNRKEAIETLIWLIVGHLFGLYNPNQLAEAIEGDCQIQSLSPACQLECVSMEATFAGSGLPPSP